MPINSKKNTASQRRYKHLIDRELKNIYEGDDDLKTIHRAGGGRRLLKFTIFLAILAAISWAGFFVFESKIRFSGSGVNVTVDGPEELISGEEVSYFIRYKNNESVPLKNVSVSILISRGFELKEAVPAPSKQNTWNLGDIEQGGDGKIKLTGVVAGGLDGIVTIQTVFIYTPANFNSEFQKVVTRASKIRDSLVTLSLNGSTKILPGEEGVWTLDYKYEGKMSLPNAELRLTPSPKFIFKSSEPLAGKEKNNEIVWSLGTLEPNFSKKLIVKATFASEATGMETQIMRLGFLDNEGVFLLQKEITAISEIKKGDVVLTLVLNGSTNDRAETLGSDLRYSLTIQNQGEDSIYTIEPSLILNARPTKGTSTPLDWRTLETSPAGERHDSRIVWTKKTVPELAKLTPGEEITFDVQIKTVSGLLPLNDRNYAVSAWAEAKTGERVIKQLQSKAITALIASDLSLKVEGRYFNDDNIALGTGPIPPKVGETTTYKIFFEITNSLHEITDLTVSGRLPENVTWTDKAQAQIGEIKWDPDSRAVLWRIPRLSLTLKNARADFEVSVTPKQDDIGKILTLLEPASVQGKDMTTETLVFQTHSAITTNLDTDPEAAGKGEVVSGK